MTDPERRESYRDSIAAGMMHATLVLPELAGPLPARIEDLSIGGAGVVVPANVGPMIANGSTLELQFTSPKAPGILVRAPSRVVHVMPRVDDSFVVGLHFTSPAELQKQLPPELTALLNRRRAFRIEPAANTKIAVQLKPVKPVPGMKPGNGTLLDISATGARVLIDAETNKTYGMMPTMQVAFTLPGTKEEVVLPVSVRAQVLFSNGVRLGLFFEGKGTRDWTKCERLITQYITRRQIEKRKGG